jgi:NAD(P) transhydrogenase subunit alpha
MYGTNLLNLLKLMTPGKDGRLVLDFDDVVQRSMSVVRDGELTWPPPPIQVSATPPAQAPSAPVVSAVKPPLTTRRLFVGVAVAAALLFLLAAAAPAALLPHLTVFVLAIVIGYYVIGHVHHALHTPLMSVTNAISGIVVVGALLQIGHKGTGHGVLVTVLSTVAILLASINIFGGFAVTRRMLAMFTRS